MTLVSIPDRVYETPVGTFTAQELIRVMAGHVTLDDDEVVYDDEGNVEFFTYELGEGNMRSDLMDWFYSQFHPDFQGPPADFLFTSVEVGSWSPLKAGLGLEEAYGGRGFLPGPTVAVYKRLVLGRLNVPGLRSTIMNLMSFPDKGTIYSTKSWRGRSKDRRRAVSRWLREHEGEWIAAQSW